MLKTIQSRCALCAATTSGERRLPFVTSMVVMPARLAERTRSQSQLQSVGSPPAKVIFRKKGARRSISRSDSLRGRWPWGRMSARTSWNVAKQKRHLMLQGCQR